MLLLPIFLSSCTPTCDAVCRKLVEECEGLPTERMTRAECELSCREQDELYAEWTDTQLRESFRDELRCLGESSCEEIAGGVCYDEELWAF